MKILVRILIISLICAMVIFGLIFFKVEDVIETQLEKAILQEYPGTNKVELEIDLGKKLQIKKLIININGWHLKPWEINNFTGNFSQVKINWLYLIKERKLVFTEIGKGYIQIDIDNSNLNKAVKSYYPGLNVKLLKDKVRVYLEVKLFNKVLKADVDGTLIPDKDAGISFKPLNLNIAGYEMPGLIRDEILKNIKINLNLEEIPFHFQVTTVKIMQEKIIINGYV